jgi:hypothetical protein
MQQLKMSNAMQRGMIATNARAPNEENEGGRSGKHKDLKE